MAHIEESFGQMYHERARLPLPPSAAAMWLSPARRRGKGMFSLGQEAPKPPCAEGYMPFGFISQQSYNEIVRENLYRMGYLTTRDAAPAVVSEALSRWYFSKPDRPFGVACMGRGDTVIANSTMLEALQTEPPIGVAEPRPEKPPLASRQAGMLAIGVGGVLVLGVVGYLIWRRSR